MSTGEHTHVCGPAGSARTDPPVSDEAQVTAASSARAVRQDDTRRPAGGFGCLWLGTAQPGELRAALQVGFALGDDRGEDVRGEHGVLLRVGVVLTSPASF